MNTRRHATRIGVAALALLACAACSHRGETEIGPSAVRLAQRMQPGDAPQLERGRYLVRVGDCKACHTAPNGKPFAGGRAIPTPFGTLYSSNITPDAATGIGAWSAADLYRAMHEGIGRDGRRLYPAFPYPWYTRVTHQDVVAMKAYLDTLAPVRHRVEENALPWPLDVRENMIVWNGLFFDPGTFQPDPKRSETWNRGAYLVRGLGHCGACHSPKNFAGAVSHDDPLGGGHAEHAFAPALTGNTRDGLGGWSEQDIERYLATGHNDKSAAAGPMAEVVENSTRYLSHDDLHAIAVYLKSLPGEKDDDAATGSVDRTHLDRGAALYLDNCQGCHLQDGQGEPGAFPPLRRSAAVQADSAQTLIGVILAGARIPRTAADQTGLAMQGFADHLTDQEIADLTTYIRNAWGNHAPPVSAGEVRDQRRTLRERPGG